MTYITKKKFANMFNVYENASELILKFAVAGIDVQIIRKRLENLAYLAAICHVILDDADMWDLATLNTLNINRELFKKKVMKIKDLKKCGAISDLGIECFIIAMRKEMYNANDGQPWERWIASDRQFCEKMLAKLALSMDADEKYSEYKKHEISSSN